MMLQATALAALSDRVRHGFFTRAGGVSDGIYDSLNGGLGSRDDAARVAENRARMAAALGVAPERFVTAYQVHSADVVVAQAPWSRADAPRADAIVTCVPGLAVGVGTADCGPVLFADAQAGVVGAAHAGWKGAVSGVLEATVVAMERLGATRAHIVAALGPTISQPNYEVGAEFVARFVRDDPGNAQFFSAAARDGHALFDLPGYIAAQLAAAGIGGFEDLGLCTYGDAAQFFSYRRATHRAEADYGRHVNAIALVG
jgi:polyphenol oxidase